MAAPVLSGRSRLVRALDRAFRRFRETHDEWNESAHPRGGDPTNSGRFSKGGGGGSSKTKTASAQQNLTASAQQNFPGMTPRAELVAPKTAEPGEKVRWSAPPEALKRQLKRAGLQLKPTEVAPKNAEFEPTEQAKQVAAAKGLVWSPTAFRWIRPDVPVAPVVHPAPGLPAPEKGANVVNRLLAGEPVGTSSMAVGAPHGVTWEGGIRNALRAEQRKHAVKLFHQGWAYAAIAKHLGIPYKNVRRWNHPLKELPANFQQMSVAEAEAWVAKARKEGKKKQAVPVAAEPVHELPNDPQEREGERARRENDLAATPPREKKNLGKGGIAEYKWIVTLENGHKAVFKEDRGEAGSPSDPTRPDITWGFQSARENAAWQIAKVIGLDDLVPASVVREIDGEKGILMEFNSGERAGNRDWGDKYDGPKDLARAGAFDFIIGNEDRHDSNWLVDKDSEGRDKLVLIDHSLAFPDHTSSGFQPNWHNNSILQEAANKLRALPAKEIVNSYVKNKDAILAKVREAGLSEKAVDGVAERIDALGAGITWRGLLEGVYHAADPDPSEWGARPSSDPQPAAQSSNKKWELNPFVVRKAAEPVAAPHSDVNPEWDPPEAFAPEVYAQALKEAAKESNMPAAMAKLREKLGSVEWDPAQMKWVPVQPPVAEGLTARMNKIAAQQSEAEREKAAVKAVFPELNDPALASAAGREA